MTRIERMGFKYGTSCWGDYTTIVVKRPVLVVGGLGNQVQRTYRGPGITEASLIRPFVPFVIVVSTTYSECEDPHHCFPLSPLTGVIMLSSLSSLSSLVAAMLGIIVAATMIVIVAPTPRASKALLNLCGRCVLCARCGRCALCVLFMLCGETSVGLPWSPGFRLAPRLICHSDDERV